MTQTYAAPGPGTWEQDAIHCPRPLTAWIYEAVQDAFPRGFKEGTARYGLLFSHLEPALVNGFIYYRNVMVDPNDREEVGRRFEASRNAFETRIWLEDLERWDREYKPDSIRRNRELEATSVDKLDTEALIAHLALVHDNSREMLYRHHLFTASSVIPMGTYLANAAEWTGLENGVLLAPLKGSTPVSLGAHEELLQVGASLRQAGIGPKGFSDMSAPEALYALKHRNDALGEAVQQYLRAIGLRLAGGYDVADPCAIELPDMLLGTIWASANEMSRSNGEDTSAAVVRNAVPEQHRKMFDELLGDARRMSRLRDERGMYNDIWGTGIARHALLETGRRLTAAARIDEVENALDATGDELVALLRGGGPPKAELQQRTEWRRTAPLSEAPPFLGSPPTPPPPMDGLPPYAIQAMRAMGASMHELFVPAPATPGATIIGKPVSPGVYTGTARVVRHPGDFNRLSKGNVLVTASTSASFNVVLPLLGAIVTDRGGQLSHAAIVAREYGIPAVVGSLKATSVIPDGSQVRVDGNTGRVDVL